MTFSIFIPDTEIRQQRGKPYPAIFFLSGLTSNHERLVWQTHIARYAKKEKIIIIFPDNCPRNTGI
jgi:S-formylglutathione hydrolase FrmB